MVAQAIADAFLGMDADRSGTVDPKEFRETLYKLNIPMTAAQVRPSPPHRLSSALRPPPFAALLPDMAAHRRSTGCSSFSTRTATA